MSANPTNTPRNVAEAEIRIDFRDKALDCKSCGTPFIWSAQEQQYMWGAGLHEDPARCPECAAKFTKTAEPAPAQSLVLKQTAELGKAIISEAEKREQERRQEKVIAEVQRLIGARDDYARKAEFDKKASEWYVAKLAAVQAGQFDFDRVTAQMIFHDRELNRANY